MNVFSSYVVLARLFTGNTGCKMCSLSQGTLHDNEFTIVRYTWFYLFHLRVFEMSIPRIFID